MAIAESLGAFTAPAGFPDSAAVERLAFKANSVDGSLAGREFDESLHVLAAQAGSEPAESALQLLGIPLPPTDEPACLEEARNWVETQSGIGSGRAVVLSLQGAQVVWSPCHVAVLARPDRLPLMRRAAIEFTFYESELRAIERAVAQRWPELETDAPLTFEFNERALGRRQELGKRMQQSIALRARFARLAPHLSVPALFPPTLASQIGERLRERLRTHERLEFVDRQIEAFERVYEMCGTRVNEFALARKGNALEMIIIVLLTAQLLLQLFGYMAQMAE